MRLKVGYVSLGFLRPKLRRRLRSLGFSMSAFGVNSQAIMAWGYRSVAKRSEWLASLTKKSILRVEDAPLRSVLPGWREAPAGLIIDSQSLYFCANEPSDLDDILGGEVPKESQEYAKDLMQLQIKMGLSKYNLSPRGGWSYKGYILVIDQTRDDASIRLGGADAGDFETMLNDAKAAYPSHKIIIRTHPAGLGYFDDRHCDERTFLSSDPANPWDILENAEDVYVVTSQMGFEAIMAGHRPHIYGLPFYSGWGLSHDKRPIKRYRKIKIEELYWAFMCQYPSWFDAAGNPASLEDAVYAIYAKAKHYWRFGQGVKLNQMRAWKRPHLKKYFPNQNSQEQVLSWGARQSEADWILEDGFMRSVGLGAELVPPLSLIVDKKGIYFDPRSPSDLEELVYKAKSIGPLERSRVERLRRHIIEKDIDKYNLQSELDFQRPSEREVILIAGQVSDDRSVELGANGVVKTTEQLVKAVRKDNPEAFLIYKPHPDVVAGLRKGDVFSHEADLVIKNIPVSKLWNAIDHVASLTSLTGFEALLRGKKVSCYGTPFYADWGLTQDYAPSTNRRGNATIEELVFAALINYPIYFDPVESVISTPEIIIERLANNDVRQPILLRMATKLQIYFYKFCEKSGLKMN